MTATTYHETQMGTTAYAVVPIWVSWYVVAVITWDLGNNFWTEMPEWRYLLLLVFVYLWVHT